MRVNHLEPTVSQIATWTPPAQTAASRDGAPGPLDLHKLMRLLRWHMRMIATLVAVMVVGAGLVLAILPPKYKAVTVVLVDPRQPRVTASEAVLSGIGADAAAVESQVELIQSSALAKRVIAKLALDQDPEFTTRSLIDSLRGAVSSLFGGLGDDEAVRLNRLIYRFQTGLSVQRRGLTYILEVGYSSTEPQKAQRISSAVAEAYLEDQRTRRSSVTADASGWLGGRIDELRHRLERSERAVADYKATNSIVNVTQGNKLISRQIEDITQQIALARSRKAEAQGRLEQVKDVTRQPEHTSGLVEVLQSPVVSQLRTQYAEVARQEADFRAIYGDRHPSIVAIRAQATDLRRQIEREIARVVDGIRNDYQVAKSREAALETELVTLRSRADSQAQTDVRLNELEREAQSDRALYEAFLNRAKETGEQQSLQIAEARIASPALVPIKPERPPALLLLAAAAILGLLLGIGLVLILEQLRRTFRSAEEVEQTLGVRTLGVLPEQVAGRNADLKHAVRSVIDRPTSDYAGSLWSLMTRLQRTQSQRGREVLAIVSAVPNEGKSTLASNLALAYAASGLKTVLIDGDCYAMSVTSAFGLNRPGLNEVLEGRAKLSNALVRDAQSGLFVLAAREPSSAAREAGDKALASLLRELREQFELIIVDCPAILPVDGGSFVEHADRIAFVIAWDETDRGAVEEAFALLGSHLSKLAGVVLNKASPRWYGTFDGGRYLRYANPPAPAPAPAPTPITAVTRAAFTRRAAR
jgi:capsular exopolysaccharide synthesis family protein